MRHAVLGAGGVGGLVGGALAKAGHPVILLVRPGRQHRYPERLSVQSETLGGFEAPVRVADRLDGRFDVVWITVKATALEAALGAVPPEELGGGARHEGVGLAESTPEPRRGAPMTNYDALVAALGRVTAKTFVMPIDEDMFFPPRDCAAEQELIPNSELRVIESTGGHLGLFAFEPNYLPQIDHHHLGELLEAPAS